MKTLCNKVLLVEDNFAEADLTRIIYREKNLPVEIIHFSNGEEFLRELPSIQLNEVCYVLLDLNMPRLNGYEVLSAMALHEKFKSIIVIIFSSSNSASDVAKCYELGAKAYVTKPLNLDELERTISCIHNFWFGVNLKPDLN
jgi:CheY-like chemotaxis protein